MKILGHRGSAGTAPENTLLAFAKGLEYGADGFEFDVQMTRDGEIVICHDERVDRTSNGSGWIKDYSLKELKRLNFGVNFGVYAPIPTLEELLEFLKGKPLLLNVEIKSEIINYPGIVDKVVLGLDKYSVLSHSIISSFSAATVGEAAVKYPEAQAGLLVSKKNPDLCMYAKNLGAKHLHPYFPLITAPLVEECHLRGMGITAWTVDKRWAMKRMAMLRVDKVITNYPEQFIMK